MRRKRSGQLRMCSNISTETTRSKVPGASKRFMSQVTISTFVEAAPVGLAEDELPLARRVGDPHHPRGREVLGGPEGEAPPAAAELEDAVPVLDAGALRGEAQHGLLGGVEGLDARRASSRRSTSSARRGRCGRRRREPRSAARWRAAGTGATSAPFIAAMKRASAASRSSCRRSSSRIRLFRRRRIPRRTTGVGTNPLSASSIPRLMEEYLNRLNRPRKRKLP